MEGVSDAGLPNPLISLLYQPPNGESVAALQLSGTL